MRDLRLADQLLTVAHPTVLPHTVTTVEAGILNALIAGALQVVAPHPTPVRMVGGEDPRSIRLDVSRLPNWHADVLGDRRGVGTRQIGMEVSDQAPQLLVVDGQQRLTALFAVLTGRKIVTKSFDQINIRMAFRPEDQTFEVTDAAIERDAQVRDAVETGSRARTRAPIRANSRPGSPARSSRSSSVSDTTRTTSGLPK
jgi:hypothetical protein